MEIIFIEPEIETYDIDGFAVAGLFVPADTCSASDPPLNAIDGLFSNL